MASIGSQKIRATQGREDEAGKRYAEIRDIIIANSDISFKVAIQKIAQIDKGSYYNYTALGGKQYGCVSLYTVENLSEFFGLPLGVFDCSLPFDTKAKQKIADVARKHFKNSEISTDNNKANEPENVSITILSNMNDLAIQLNKEDNIDILEKALGTLGTLTSITKNKIDILRSLDKLKEEK